MYCLQLCFVGSGKWLLSIGMEEAAKVYTWNWDQKARIEARALASGDPPSEYNFADEKPAGIRIYSVYVVATEG